MEHSPELVLLVVVSACLVLWSVFSARLERVSITAPIAFVVLGFLFANPPVSMVHVGIHSSTLLVLAEVTLALLLFADAAAVRHRELRRDAGLPVRLLVVGLPLTIALGIGVALLVFSDLPPAAAAVIATAVAPTDAALGAAVTGNPEVPRRIRRALGVESGLNDGIATPFVLFFIAAAATSEAGRGAAPEAAVALGDVITGVLVGLGAGFGGGLLLALAGRRGWAAQKYRATGVLALALFTYGAAVQLGGNGFIAAFVGGLAFGAVVVRPVRRSSLGFDARAGEMLSLLVWFVFGTLAVTVLGAAMSWRTVVFAVLALTVIRFVPVALSLLGSHLGWWSVAFIGWFGPRGLASVVFGVIASDALPGAEGDTVVATITLTVLLSVVAHGLTAAPFARRYAAWAGRPGARP
jgi:NhaP-type Na+/H+ or K+/H+ antiporter